MFLLQEIDNVKEIDYYMILLYGLIPILVTLTIIITIVYIVLIYRLFRKSKTVVSRNTQQMQNKLIQLLILQVR